MVGRDVNLRAASGSDARGTAVLHIDGLHVRDETGHEKVRGVSLEVHARGNPGHRGRRRQRPIGTGRGDHALARGKAAACF